MNASRNIKLGALAVTAVALVAAGGAFAAGKYHGSKASAASGLSTGWYVGSATGARSLPTTTGAHQTTTLLRLRPTSASARATCKQHSGQERRSPRSQTPPAASPRQD